MSSTIPFNEYFDKKSLCHQQLEKSLSFISTLYNYNDISRTRVQNIITECSTLISNSSLNIFTKGLLLRLEELGESKEKLRYFKNLHTSLINPFDDLMTEHKRFSKLKMAGTYLPPNSVKIGERDDYRSQDERQNLVSLPVTVEFTSLKKNLQLFFECPNMLDNILEYVDFLSSNTQLLVHIIQGEVWQKKKALFGDKTVLPLILYYDDYETNSPLGSHRGIAKMGAIYIMIPCLPPHIQSKLENIFVPLLFNTLDEKEFDFKIITSKLLDELKDLESTGITIFENTSEEKTIYLTLLTVIGDNLGVNAIHGFITSFSGNYCCRFCLIDRTLIKNTCYEFAKLRT